MDRPKEIGGLAEVLDRQFEEEGLTRLAFLQFLLDTVVVFAAVPERMIENGGIRGEAGD